MKLFDIIEQLKVKSPFQLAEEIRKEEQDAKETDDDDSI